LLSLLSENSVKYVGDYFPEKPKVAVVLGSGVKALEDLEGETQLSYADIPDFPQSTVAGHAGIISVGKYQQVNIAVLRGRFHKYEGHNWRNVIAPVALMKELGVNHIILTNAAGGINRLFAPGDLMLIEDHINCHQMEEDERKNLYQVFKERRGAEFYDRSLLKLAREASAETMVRLHEGVYLSLPGPTYETRAEILMFRNINVDAVGMSTTPEAIWAKALNMKVLGISCITNSTYYEKAMSETSHEEVVTIAKKASRNIDKLLKAIISNINF
jgi:purine-nucleoside phosphorylase